MATTPETKINVELTIAEAQTLAKIASVRAGRIEAQLPNTAPENVDARLAEIDILTSGSVRLNLARLSRIYKG